MHYLFRYYTNKWVNIEEYLPPENMIVLWDEGYMFGEEIKYYEGHFIGNRDTSESPYWKRRSVCMLRDTNNPRDLSNFKRWRRFNKSEHTSRLGFALREQIQDGEKCWARF